MSDKEIDSGENLKLGFEEGLEDGLKFEEALDKLEDIVMQLEEGGLSLDRSLEVFTEGVKLIKFCNGELNQAEEKIELVLREEDGYSEVVPFQQDGEDN